MDCQIHQAAPQKKRFGFANPNRAVEGKSKVLATEMLLGLGTCSVIHRVEKVNKTLENEGKVMNKVSLIGDTR